MEKNHSLFLSSATSRITETFGKRVVVYFQLSDLKNIKQKLISKLSQGNKAVI